MNLQTLALRHGGDARRACFALAGEAELRLAATPPDALLSASELARFGALRFALKQQGFLLGRLAAKRALGALLAEPDLRRIEIQSGVFGQPLVRHPRAEGVEVTLSHSHGLAVALAYPAGFAMGVDLETVSAGAALTILGELQLSDAEQAWMAAGTLARAGACGVLWSAREALGKSMKVGLNCPLGILALDRIEPAGATAWIGRYANFPQSRCLAQAVDGRVLSVALPAAVELAPWPALTNPRLA
jgi:phosphopantetheinyl transferase